ncbi:MAG: DUF1993 domain-containing protein [Cellvibrionales bacterium TMED148]|nr:hypothetical protein [Porticoccaceae bacterium]RPG92356.1 MAG: DUF1993 domain-containing protein [Cellvibrionales bacterium TMED148]|tara:strand:- start:7 stop:675 length:669 start_codon:yes stop_codon:yes gene_type:complete
MLFIQIRLDEIIFRALEQQKGLTMSLTLYQSSVQSFIQTISAILTCLDKGRKFCRDNNIDRNEFIDARLHPSMLPLHFQIVTLVHFSEGAIDAAEKGVVGGPDMTLEFDYDGLQTYLASSLERLGALNESEVNALISGEVIFKYEGVILPFTTEDFFVTYALPNFYFHATVAYSILRSSGVPVGIANYIGKVKTTASPNIASQFHQYTGADYLDFLEEIAGL